MFKLKSDFRLTEDQKKAVELLSKGVDRKMKNQVLLGVTGSGKTFTMANIVERLKLPTLIITHNKTLAGQLYQEMRQFFPDNATSYFVSYYDYYQPEAYIPQTDTYIEKEASINELIDKLRLATTTNILTRDDVIVVASVSCIYNIGSPVEYERFALELNIGNSISREKIFKRLVSLQYERSEFDFKRGTFRVRGDSIDIYPAYEETGLRITLKEEKITKFLMIDPLTGQEKKDSSKRQDKVIIYPAKHYLTDPVIFEKTESQIRSDLKKEYQKLKKKGRLLEAERLIRRVNYDLEMIREVGYVNGIENYSRYFDGRQPGQPPYTLIDYFKNRCDDGWLVFLDESHMTVPQLEGMYNGDFARKKTLVEHGFRLKAAFDNRPLKFKEFYSQVPTIIYLSATPSVWEINQAKKSAAKIKNKSADKPHSGVVEQLVRPTGIIDPKIYLHRTKREIFHLIEEIEKRVSNNERVLVTTLTKRIAEDLTFYFKEKGIKAEYLHSDIKTLERTDILDKLRKGEYDVLVGINLLREGLDLPEVALVAILDADKEGFLRSRTSLIQTMGRAARNVRGEVIIYSDVMTKSIKEAVCEVERRRKYQIEYNKRYGVKPKTISKPLRGKIIEEKDYRSVEPTVSLVNISQYLTGIDQSSLTPYDKKKIVKKLEKEMRKQAQQLNFELAIEIRDKIRELKK